jgi:hypothetical protein
VTNGKHPGGRPTKYDPVYCERVIELGEQGASVVEMAYSIRVARSTLEEAWPASYPEFSEALTRAREASQVWWEIAGRVGMTSDKFNASVWSRSMAARFPKDWREKQLIGSDPENPLPAGFILKGIPGVEE